MDITFLLSDIVSISTPLLFATLGEVLTERGGVINLGIEGIILVGAVGGYLVSYRTGNPYLGILAAMLIGGGMASIHSFVTVTLKANQIVSGLAITLLGTGLSTFLGKDLILVTASGFSKISIPLFSQIPFIGKVIFSQNILVYLSFITVIVLLVFLYKTRWGLNLRTVGENPASADAMGISVDFMRYSGVILGGILVGLGGGYITLAYTNFWVEGITGGRGWIAIALTVFSGWSPSRALIGAYLFGSLTRFQFTLQAGGAVSGTTPYFLQMIPYLATIIVLVFFAVKESLGWVSTPPAALGVPYYRQKKEF